MFGFRCFGVAASGGVMPRLELGLIVVLLFLEVTEGWCVAVVCFSEVWCLGFVG